MRAVAEDKDTAALMGVNVDRIITTTFAAGSSLAAVAGVMVGMYYSQIGHMMGHAVFQCVQDMKHQDGTSIPLHQPLHVLHDCRLHDIE